MHFHEQMHGQTQPISISSYHSLLQQEAINRRGNCYIEILQGLP